LRLFLCQNGFRIEKEAVASEKHGSKLYLVISAYYSGGKRDAGELYYLTGELPSCGGGNARAYIEKKAHMLSKKAAGLNMAKNETEDEKSAAQKAKALADRLFEICKSL